MLATYAIVIDQQLLAGEACVVGLGVAQRQRAILALATQVQGDLRGQAGAQAVADCPWRARVIATRRAVQALGKCLGGGLPEAVAERGRLWQQLFLVTRDEPGIEFGLGKRRVSDDSTQEVDVGLEPADGEFIEHTQ
ncbi:hypothetical protein D9M71_743530 [compost metagenome]